MKPISLIIVFLMILTGCNKDLKKADMIINNATIYTTDSSFSIAEAMAVKDGKIMAVGTNEEINNKFSGEKKINMQGKFIYPGFIDPHSHFYGYGLSLGNADLTGTTSFKEIIEILENHHKNHPGEWLTGRGWDQNDWADKEFPTRKLLDKKFPGVPLLLTRIDGHAALASGEALKRANITPDTKIEGGEILIKNGMLSGILIDNAIELVEKIIPKPDSATMANALLKAQANCFAVGLTTVSDAGLDAQVINLMDKLQQEDTLKMKIYAMLNPTDENFEQYVSHGIYQTPRLDVRSIKLFADGALGSRGALLLKPYTDDPGNSGLLLKHPDYYREMCHIAFSANYQVNTHCIGDSAVRLMLSVYGEFLKGKNDRRWRIEHAQIVDPSDLPLFGKYSVIPSVQTTHATSDMYWAGNRIGPERLKNAYIYKELLQQNGWLPNGSDFPVESINPLYGFYAGITRKDHKGYPAGGFQPENAITREQALRAMTIWAAKACFEEDIKGSIEPGKAADFVVTSEDIMNMDVQNIPQLKIDQTFVDGICVYPK
ncbi:MAG TPA: amidohydrolase [Bacteroidales bacterium]|nr:amidohydrolase [Bacteroidales bacterium]